MEFNKYRNRALSFIFFGIFSLGVFSSASAAIIVDQEFSTTDDPNHNTGLGIVVDSLAQSFTVGVSGILNSIEFNILGINATDDVTFDIRNMVGGSPDALESNALFSTVISNGDIGSFGSQPYSWSSIVVDVSSANLSVSAGDQYAFVLGSEIGQEYGVQTDYLNGYSGGNRFQQLGDGTAFGSSDFFDLTFKTTVNQVPEPSILALFSASLAGLGLIRRRKKQQA